MDNKSLFNNQYKLGILGLGKMGGSILSGIIKSNIYRKSDVLLFDVNETVINNYTNDGFTFALCEKELIEKSEIILIAIKPQMFYRLKELDLDKELDNKYSVKTIVSIAAGKTIDDLKEIFGCQKYIRVMPNTPALISCGATAIARDKDVDDETFNNIKNIFESIGVALEISEDKMNEIIPVNGSMPAYLYYFAEGFIEDAVKNGIDYEVAKKLACEAIIGSAKMILETNKPINELIKDVCSPGGATLEGMKALDEGKFKETIYKTSKACIDKAYELSRK